MWFFSKTKTPLYTIIKQLFCNLHKTKTIHNSLFHFTSGVPCMAGHVTLTIILSFSTSGTLSMAGHVTLAILYLSLLQVRCPWPTQDQAQMDLSSSSAQRKQTGRYRLSDLHVCLVPSVARHFTVRISPQYLLC